MAGLPDIPLPAMLEPPSGRPTHRCRSWALYTQRKAKKHAGASWYDGVQCIGRFSTIEGFWQVSTRCTFPRRVRARSLRPPAPPTCTAP